MSVLQLRTFGDIVSAIREMVQESSTNVTAINRIKRDVNIVYQDVVSEKQWQWLFGNIGLTLPAFISAGTADVTASSNIVTLSVAPTSSQTGKLFSSDSYNEIYRIESHIAGSTTLRLETEYTGTTTPGSSYKIWTDRLPLPANLKEIVKVWHDHFRTGVEELSLEEFRRIQATDPKAEGRPRYCYLGNFVDPTDSSVITSLPSLSTRASNGVVKTLVFSTSIPTTIVTRISAGDPVRWKISSASNPGYNGDITITSVSTTSLANDTITYTNPYSENESAVADSNMVIRSLDSESDYDRYRELFLYPAVYSARTTIHCDFVKEAAPLENDSDEPLIPKEWRSVLYHGGLAKQWKRMRNREDAADEFTLMENVLLKMQGRYQENQEKPRLVPSSNYLGTKRNSSRTRSLDSGGAGSSGGSSQAIVSGNPSTVAVYGTDGEITSLSTVSSTEVGYLDGVTSNIQVQLDSKFSNVLANGAIFVGNASNVATGIVPTGDVTVTNGGVTAISSGVIVDGDISASAAIDQSKMAALTVSRAMVTDGSGIASTASVTATELGYVSGVTSALQTQLNGKASTTHTHAASDITTGQLATARGGTGQDFSASTGVVKVASGTASASAIVNADVSSSAAIAYTKLNLATSIVNGDVAAAAAIARTKVANGTVNHVVINDGSGTLSSEANLAVSRGGTGVGTLTANNVILGAGTSAVTFVAPSSSGNVLTSNGTTWTSAPATGGSSSTSSNELYNLGLATSVASNLLTVALKQSDGSTDPSTGTAAVKIGFRNSTLATGGYNERSVTASLSMTTVATGATLGLTSAQDQYIYVYAIDNAGTVELALAGSRAFDEGARYSTTAMSGSATNAQVLYSTTARTNVPVRLIGRLKSNQTTSGTYASNATEIALTPFDGNRRAYGSSLMYSPSGHGSTNTKIRHFTVVADTGSDTTSTSNSTSGASVTIVTPGVYAIDYVDGADSGTLQLGISYNAVSTLTTNILSVSIANGYLAGIEASSARASTSVTRRFTQGDIIRPHTNGLSTVTTAEQALFRVTRISD